MNKYKYIFIGTLIGWVLVFLASFVHASSIPDDKAILAIIGEAESQGFDGMLAVASAIRNRGTLQGVYGLNAPRVKKSLYTKGTYLQARKAWLQSASGRDVVMGANSWENVNAFGRPYWIDTCKPTVTVKDHQFFVCPTPKKGV